MYNTGIMSEEMNMTYEYIYHPGSYFEYDRLDEFCEAIGVNYHVGWYGDRTVIMFLSDNYHHIEEVREQLPNNVH